MQQLPLRSELAHDQPPDRDEILRALGRNTVDNYKAGGVNGLLPDVLKRCGGPLLDYILKLFYTVWEEKCVPSEWIDVSNSPCALVVIIGEVEPLASWM